MATYRIVAKHTRPSSDWFSTKDFEASNVIVSNDGDLLLIEYNHKSMVPEYFPIAGFASGDWSRFVRISD